VYFDKKYKTILNKMKIFLLISPLALVRILLICALIFLYPKRAINNLILITFQNKDKI